MIEVVNEVAVVGSTFFMMALGTVWFSMIPSSKKQDTVEETNGKYIAALTLGGTFVCYFCMLWILAYAALVAPLIPVPIFALWLGACVFALSALFAHAQSEARPLTYYIAHGGFYAVFISGGLFMLIHWPW